MVVLLWRRNVIPDIRAPKLQSDIKMRLFQIAGLIAFFHDQNAVLPVRLIVIWLRSSAVENLTRFMRR
jgi:hypothetical protein